jgi:hypothetical protein
MRPTLLGKIAMMVQMAVITTFLISNMYTWHINFLHMLLLYNSAATIIGSLVHYALLSTVYFLRHHEKEPL